MGRPFVPKKRSFAFPAPERMGQRVLEICGLTHGYGDRALFDNVSLEIEKGERVSIIGAGTPCCQLVLGSTRCGQSHSPRNWLQLALLARHILYAEDEKVLTVGSPPQVRTAAARARSCA